jgi:hypothetical protein
VAGQPTQGHPRDLSPLFFHLNGSHERSVGHVGYFWVSKRERNRRFKEGKEKPSSATFVSLREEDDKQCYQNDIVCSFFFSMKNE